MTVEIGTQPYNLLDEGNILNGTISGNFTDDTLGGRVVVPVMKS